MAAAKKKQEEAENILAKARRRTSSKDTAPKPKTDLPNVKSPVNNPRPGKKPPRKLEKRGSVA